MVFLRIITGFSLAWLLHNAHLFSQNSVSISPLGAFVMQSSFDYATSACIDRLGRDYVYLTCMEDGLIVVDISNLSAPQPVDTVTMAELGGLAVSDAAQDSQLLYLSLGAYEGIDQRSGIAIVDVSDPLNPVVRDEWDSAAFVKGAARIAIELPHAFIGAMEAGVIATDVSDPDVIRFVGHILPDPTQGDPGIFTPAVRGLSVDNGTMLVAFDQGRLRIVDAADPGQMVESGIWSNASLNAVADPAYNQVLRIGDYAWTTLDYCGMEVVHVADPANTAFSAIYNPWNCNNGAGQGWLDADIHGNELVFVPGDSLVMMAGTDSEVLVFDARDPATPQFLGSWGPANDSLISDGLDAYNGLIALARVKTPFPPVPANSGGLQLLSYQLLLNQEEQSPHAFISAVPNPSNGNPQLRVRPVHSGSWQLQIWNQAGEVMLMHEGNSQAGEEMKWELSLDGWPAGMYECVFTHTSEVTSLKLVKH